jgi:prophage regulatory protein
MNPKQIHILRLPEVRARTGRGTTAIYDMMGRGEFPRSIPIGDRAVGWRSDEVDDWIEAQTAKRDARVASS